MRLRFPSRKVCQRFALIYETQGCQRAVDYLTQYYGVRRLKLIIDGRKVITTKTHKKYAAHYYRNKAYFVRRFLNRSTVLHELFHHLVEAKRLTMPLYEEERRADEFGRKFMRRRAYWGNFKSL